MKTLRLVLACAALSASCFPSASLFAQGTAFTYQGVLSQGGAAVNGSNDLTFTLYNAASGGGTVGTSNVVNDLVMSNGLFAVTLDFGAGAFDGAPRWLQIAARPGASTAGYTILAPRTPIMATPYAIYAGGVSAAGLVGTLPANALAGVNGGGLIGLSAANLVGTVPTARLSTNVALRAGGNTFGGNQAFSGGKLSLAGTSTFEFGAGVAGKQTSAGMIGYEAFTPGALDIVGAGNTPIERRVQLWEQVHVGNFEADGKPRLISFGDGDFVSIGESGADDRMELTAGAFVFKNGSVGIGTDSPSAKLDVVGNILASGRVGIGISNPPTKLTVFESTYGIEHTDGIRRLATYIDASGCYFGTVSTDPLLFYVNDGGANMVVNTNGRVGIGTLAPVSQLEVAGTVTASGFSGDGSRLTGIGASNLTGNLPDSSLSANVARRDVGNIFSGDQRINSGSLNVPNGQISVGGTLLVGGNQTVSGTVTANGFAGSGSGLTGIPAASLTGTLDPAQIPNLDAAKIVTGRLADARLSANAALRSGGNTFTGNQVVTNGSGFFGNHTGGLAGGGPGVRVFRDTFTGAGSIFAYDYGANASLPLTLQQPGGNVGIGTTTPATKLHVAGEVTTTAVNITSDRNAKEQFKPVNAREVLDKVAALPITEWQYKTQADARHIGPMAQDFRAAFGVGRDEKHITSVDADGVALAAIQGLNEVVREQRAAIEKLEARNQELEERLAGRLAALEKLLETSSRAGRP